MNAKKLEVGSSYNEMDLDGDGVVTDRELQMSERMIQIENHNALQDQQRQMAWVAMASTIVIVVVLLSPLIPIDRMDAASAFLNTWLIAQTGVVGGFMATTVLSKRNESKGM